MKNLLIYTSLLLAGQLILTGPAIAQEITIPEAWAGVWENTTTEMDCETMEIVSVTTSIDTFCAGDILNPDDPDGGLLEFDCEGSADDTTYHLECTGTGEIFPGCSVTFSYVTDGTRSGNTSEGVSVQTTTYEGTCFVEDTCTRYETTSVRLEEDPDCELTPVLSASWGSLKSNYR